jgi:putative Mg2+ transporter-C (MgtC) family protein
MMVSAEQAAINLAVAVALGAIVGFERQWRNRLAGLRTNTLVSLGAASFVVFAALFPGESSPTRVAAQVLSGIGFLGAGVIFRDGLNVRGLNTAATLWCSAAIGVLAGAGYVGARCDRDRIRCVREPVAAADRQVHQPSASGFDRTRDWLSRCDHVPQPGRGAYPALLLQSLGNTGLALRRLDSKDLNGSGRVLVSAFVTAHQRVDTGVEKIVGRLSLEPTVSAARWQALADVDLEGSIQ